jgi:hypothetical protein
MRFAEGRRRPVRSSTLREVTLPALNGGINTRDPETGIADNQSPDMLNLWYKDMALCKRPGQMLMAALKDVKRISEPYNGSFAVHAGDHLYRWDGLGAVRYLPEYRAEFEFEAGDWFVAAAAGMVDGIAYQAGDCLIYNVTNSAGQVETAAVMTGPEGITASGNAAVTVISRDVMGSPLRFDVAVEAGDTAAQAAEKIRAALGESGALTAVYAVGGEGGKVTLTRMDTMTKDATLNIAVENGTCAGLVDALKSADTPFWHKALTLAGGGAALGEQPGVFCEFGDTLYYIQGGEIWQIAPDYSVSATKPYVPTVLLSARPDLSESDDGEAYNLIGTGFTVRYNGDGQAKVFKLPQAGLSSEAVTATVGIDTEPYIETLTEGEGITVDRQAGTITFSTAPMAGTNNVWITAHKDVPGAKEKITGCTAAIRFGGESAGVTGGTRVFVMGNPDYPYHYWRSDLGLHVSAGMAYFPDTSEEVLDQNSDAITAAAKMGEQLIVFKENSIFAIGYSYDGKDVYYPVRECHSAIGCDMPGSVQLIDNRLVFAHSRSGVHMLVSTDNVLENIVKPLSANVNALLLCEPDLKDACSCDFERYYWLKAGRHVYLWDYDTTPYYNYADYDKAQRRLAWYRFDNMDATVFCPLEGALCYGSAEGIVRLTSGHNDFGKAINAYFLSKAFDMGSPDELKTFVALYPGFSADGNILVTVTAANESTDSFKSWEVDARSFDWEKFNWAAFTWNRIKFAQAVKMRLNMRKASFLQVKMLGDTKDRGAGLSSLRFTYYMNRKVKGEGHGILKDDIHA